MCESSVYVEHRAATNREELVVRPVPGHRPLRGLYPVTGGDLVCTLPGTKLFIEEVRFRKEYVVPETIERWNGKKNVEARFASSSLYENGADAVRFSDGSVITLLSFVIGVRMNIGIPFERDLSKALQLDNPDPDIALERGTEDAENTATPRVPDTIEGDD
jgi:hypothetical protein